MLLHTDKAINDGIELAVEEINKEGIDGKKIELITVDNKSDAAESTSAALKLISQDTSICYSWSICNSELYGSSTTSSRK